MLLDSPMRLVPFNGIFKVLLRERENNKSLTSPWADPSFQMFDKQELYLFLLNVFVMECSRGRACKNIV